MQTMIGGCPEDAALIQAVTGSDRPRTYWTDLKRKLIEKEGFSEMRDFIVQLPGNVGTVRLGIPPPRGERARLPHGGRWAGARRHSTARLPLPSLRGHEHGPAASRVWLADAGGSDPTAAAGRRSPRTLK